MNDLRLRIMQQRNESPDEVRTSRESNAAAMCGELCWRAIPPILRNICHLLSGKPLGGFALRTYFNDRYTMGLVGGRAAPRGGGPPTPFGLRRGKASPSPAEAGREARPIPPGVTTSWTVDN
jgi:hypothetical protein